ncbi:hypothetical protein QYE76_025137 [Lolium multiflorum]|uniref:No apical meristem-associated C-terminal domain-containing protein n=1 Tax=Lolium multiflorum TaxID=4521 RepID=A0AAD8RDS2_LOLMU|nr:hypothetical protein QYE76_025137 [Lolium multiflorum]
MAISGSGGAMFHGQWTTQGTSSSPSSFSPSFYSPTSSAMFQEGTYIQPSRFTPSPPEFAVGNGNQYEGPSPALRRGPLPFGAMAPNDEEIHEMITSGSAAAAASPGFFMAAAAASPGFFTQEEARATAAVAARNEYVEDVADGSQAVEEEDEEEEQATQVEEEECLAEAWMTVSMNGINGANQSFDTYWLRVKQAYEERKLVDPYFNKTNMNVYRGDKAMATHWGIMQTACNKWHGIQEEIENADQRPRLGAKGMLRRPCITELRRALDMYTDDTGLQFKFLNVYARLEHCEKWKETRTTLSKSKTEQYNPDAPAAGAAEGRPELGQKKLKELKKTGNPADRMQASIDKCWADLRSHADGRNDKFDGRWREMLANQGVRIALLKTTAAAKKRNTDLAFLMGGGNMELMDEETRNWYQGHRSDILRAAPASPSSSPPAPTSASSPSTSSAAADVHCRCFVVDAAAASATACEESGLSDTAVPAGTADEPVSV